MGRYYPLMRWTQTILVLGFMAGTISAQETAAPGGTGAAFNAEGMTSEAVADQSALDVAVEKSNGGTTTTDLPVEKDPAVSIRKVYDFLNDPDKTPVGDSKALAYEFKYFDHGAITESQKLSRKGQYYVVSWANKGPAADYVLRIDYRQALTRDKIYTMEIPFAQARGSYKGTFSVTGKSYLEYGAVHSWRISVVRDGRIVAQERSFVW
jgi:hypothetical protein